MADREKTARTRIPSFEEILEIEKASTDADRIAYFERQAEKFAIIAVAGWCCAATAFVGWALLVCLFVGQL